MPPCHWAFHYHKKYNEDIISLFYGFVVLQLSCCFAYNTPIQTQHTHLWPSISSQHSSGAALDYLAADWTTVVSTGNGLKLNHWKLSQFNLKSRRGKTKVIIAAAKLNEISEKWRQVLRKVDSKRRCEVNHVTFDIIGAIWTVEIIAWRVEDR